ERFRPRRAARHVDIDGDDLVDAVHDVVLAVVGTAVDRASAHGQDPPGFGHLIVEQLHPIGHLLVHRARDDHQIGLARGSPEDHAEAVEVVAGSARGHHLDGAAGDAEEHVPQRRLAAPVDQAAQAGGDDAGHRLVAHQTQRKTPFFQAYTRPSTSMTRKITMSTKAYIPSSRRTTAHGKRNTTSTSKTTKSKAKI